MQDTCFEAAIPEIAIGENASLSAILEIAPATCGVSVSCRRSTGSDEEDGRAAAAAAMPRRILVLVRYSYGVTIRDLDIRRRCMG